MSATPKGKTMIVSREVKKTVKDANGKDFERKAIIKFEAPENPSDLDSLVSAFGSVEKLAYAAYFGVIARAKYEANNELLKGDKASKALKGMVKNIKAVMPTLSDEAALAMVLSNPEVAAAFKSEPLTAEITYSVNTANQEFVSVKKDEKTPSVAEWLGGISQESDEEADETTV